MSAWITLNGPYVYYYCDEHATRGVLKSSLLSLKVALKPSTHPLLSPLLKSTGLRMFFCEIRYALSQAPIIWCDNISVLALASNLIYHAHTKHIEIDYHFVREKVINRDIMLKFISTHDQFANVFTKRLSFARFFLLRSKLMAVSSLISLRGAIRESSSPTHVLLAATAILAASHVATKASPHAAPLAATSPIMPNNDFTTISTSAQVNSTAFICQFPSIDKANNNTAVDYIPNIASGSTIRQDITYHASHYGLTTNAAIYDRKPSHPQGKLSFTRSCASVERKEDRRSSHVKPRFPQSAL
jgi:hypothetical protein